MKQVISRARAAARGLGPMRVGLAGVLALSLLCGGASAVPTLSVTAAAPPVLTSAAAVAPHKWGKRIRTAWNKLVRPRRSVPRGNSSLQTRVVEARPSVVNAQARGVPGRSNGGAGLPVGVQQPPPPQGGRPPHVVPGSRVQPGPTAMAPTQMNQQMRHQGPASVPMRSNGLLAGQRVAPSRTGPSQIGPSPQPFAAPKPKPQQRPQRMFQIPEALRAVRRPAAVIPNVTPPTFQPPTPSAPPLTLKKAQAAPPVTPQGAVGGNRAPAGRGVAMPQPATIPTATAMSSGGPRVQLFSWKQTDANWYRKSGGGVTQLNGGVVVGVKPIHTVDGLRVHITQKATDQLASGSRSRNPAEFRQYQQQMNAQVKQQMAKALTRLEQANGSRAQQTGLVAKGGQVYGPFPPPR